MNQGWAGTPRDMRQQLVAMTGLPVACDVDAENVIVAFEVLDGPKPWTKPFIVPKAQAVPDVFVAMLDGWRKEMERKMAAHDTAGVLGAVLREFGQDRVRAALRVRVRSLH